MEQNESKIYLMMTFGAYAMLLLVLFFTTARSEGAEPFSPAAFYKPFGSTIPIVLAALAVFEVLLFHVWMMPQAMQAVQKNLRGSNIAIFMPEMIAVLGFIIGFLSLNFWVSLPFFAVAIAHSLYAFSRISEAPDNE